MTIISCLDLLKLLNLILLKIYNLQPAQDCTFKIFKPLEVGNTDDMTASASFALVVASPASSVAEAMVEAQKLRLLYLRLLLVEEQGRLLCCLNAFLLV